MRERITFVLLALLAALALIDVFTGWTLFGLPVVVGCLAGCLAGALIGKTKLRLIVALLIAAAFALHLATLLRSGYEAEDWEEISEAKARNALSRAASIVDSRFRHISDQVAEAARRNNLADALRSGEAAGIFSTLDEIRSSVTAGDDFTGMVVTEKSGRIVAWGGKLPDFIGNTFRAPDRAGMELRKSTTHYWIEAYSPVVQAEEYFGGLVLFRQLDAIYADVLPHAAPTSLVEELTRRVGHEILVFFGDDAGQPQITRARGELVEDLRLPDGTPIGKILVRERVLDDEFDLLRGQGLFIAAIVILALMGLGLVIVFRHLMGFRFRKASYFNMVLVICGMGGVRIGFSLLRDYLRLDTFEAFTSVHYGSHVPTGVLRSPADLLISGLFLAAGVLLPLLARAYHRPRSTRPVRRDGLYDRIPLLVSGVLVGVVAAGSVLAAHHLIGRVFADSSVVMFAPSVLKFTPSHVILRIAILVGSGALILLGGSLIQLQMSIIRRFNLEWGLPGKPYVLAGATVAILTMVVVLAGIGPAIFVAAIVCFACAFILDLLLQKRLTLGPVGLAVLFALAASVIQFPYVLQDHIAKQRDVIESISSRIMVRSDAWKVSVLEEALDQVAGQGEIADALLEGVTEGDALALRIWANSILSQANMVSGIHILDAGHVPVGRFSLEDMGDLSEIEGALRTARFATRPMFMATRGTFGGREIDLYVGVVPFTRLGDYLGSVVISIPYAYSDLESMAGLKPTFFDAVSTPVHPGYFEGGYSASLVSNGVILGTTARDLEVGKRISELDEVPPTEPGWIHHRVDGESYASYLVPSSEGPEALLLSLRSPSPGDNLIRCMGILAGNAILAFLIIVVWAAIEGTRHLLKRLRGRVRTRLRWSFAGKLALAFVLIAIVPTLILGATSRGFLRARLREVMESKAEEGLKLARLALERLVGGEAVRLARNPILIDELTAEPSILGMLVSHDVESAVFDSSRTVLATFGNPVVPEAVLEAVLNEGRSYRFFSAEDGLQAKSAVPVRDVIFPNRIKGCAFVSRKIDDVLASRLASEIGREVNFFGGSKVTASSKRELFISELMAGTVSPDAYLESYIGGRELHFTWDKIGGTDVVVGLSPLRGFGGSTVGAISVPLLFRKDDVSIRMEWTSAAISYLLVIVIGSIFIFGLLLARRISRPISDLIQGTLRIGSGDLSFTIPKSGDDEIGDLVSSFNKMTTALSKSRKALSERKRYIETIIGNVGAGIISTDWRGRIDTFNSAAEKLLGTKARNARGRDARSLLRRIGAASLADVLDDVGEAQDLARKEVSLSGRDRGQITMRAVASAVRGPRGRRMGKVIVFEDVTELIRSKQLIAWSEMARQVAHEIKNPLTPMKLSAQQLLQSHRDGASDFDRTLEDSIATIVEQIESLRRIAVEFSQFSRMPERRLETANINDVLEDSLGQYERTVGGSIEIDKKLDGSVPKVRFDNDELKRVFLNLIENAVQAMPAGGRLTVQSRQSGGRTEPGTYDVSVSSRGAKQTPIKDYVEVSFTDTGDGIAAENSSRLFEPNFSTKSHGSGLGLAICKGIVDGYGGEIIIESTPRAGTCVRVRIPLRKRPTSRRPRQRRDNRKWRRHRSR
jgi:PAS domain S-box-containing protein